MVAADQSIVPSRVHNYHIGCWAGFRRQNHIVTRLSKLYDAPIAVEYAREFEEACNVDDDELTAFDYERLILSKFSQNEHAIASHANHGIVFLDTDAMVTRVYAERYLPADENAKLQADIRYGD